MFPVGEGNTELVLVLAFLVSWSDSHWWLLFWFFLSHEPPTLKPIKYEYCRIKLSHRPVQQLLNLNDVKRHQLRVEVCQNVWLTPNATTSHAKILSTPQNSLEPDCRSSVAIWHCVVGTNIHHKHTTHTTYTTVRVRKHVVERESQRTSRKMRYYRIAALPFQYFQRMSHYRMDIVWKGRRNYHFQSTCDYKKNSSQISYGQANCNAFTIEFASCMIPKLGCLHREDRKTRRTSILTSIS